LVGAAPLVLESLTVVTAETALRRAIAAIVNYFIIFIYFLINLRLIVFVFMKMLIYKLFFGEKLWL